MTGLLDALGERADVVIIDAPPVIAVTDAVVLAAFVDSVVLVARHGATGRGFAAETRRRLERVGAKVAGVVLNDVKPAVVQGYYADYATPAVPVLDLRS
jgi:tyrosine-protein kinase Etk/Wzc